MGSGASKEVHVVVVQSKDDGSIDAQIVKRKSRNEGAQTFSSDESSPENVGSSLQSRKHGRRGRLRLALSQDEADTSRKHVQQPAQSLEQDSSYSLRKTHGYHQTNHDQRNGHCRKSRRVANAAQSETSSAQFRDISSVSPTSEHGKDIFEIFKTFDGEEYTVYVREDGKRFYVDWEEQKWRHFPASWFEKGTFESISYTPKVAKNSDSKEHGRSGEFIHPTRGKMTTFLKEEAMNVLHYFDESSGAWLPMPLAWERHVPFVSKMVDEIQKICPSWKNDKDIVAALRQCNYKVDDVLSVYLSIKDDGMLDNFRDFSKGRSSLIEKFQNKITELEEELLDMQDSKQKMSEQLVSLRDQIEELRTENKRLKTDMDNIKKAQKRQSLTLQRSMNHGMLQKISPFTLLQPVVQGLSQETRTLKFKLHSARSVLTKSIKLHNEQLQKLSKAVLQLTLKYRAQFKEIEETRALYRKETLQRKLLYNEIQELRGNIRVFCRCRQDSQAPCVLKFEEGERVHCTNYQGRQKMFEFERVYTPNTSQEQVFEDAKPTITSCVDGYNVCIIAYGQTGAGKTYTMMGPKDRPGVNIRSLRDLFGIIKARTRIQYSMKVSMVEVYNESIYDLLVSPHDHMQEKLQIQKKGKDIHVPGLTELEVKTEADVMKIIEIGEKNRTTASTKMNTNSSRSHLLFMLRLEGYDTVSRATSHGRLTLVDLAGSERISRSEATGLRLVEAAAINKSLSALGQVFASIRDGALHIPYRNSKLTHLLQPCIGGQSKTCMFVNVSPLESNVAETISTLEFGMNVRQVTLGKATKTVSKGIQPH